MKYTSRLIAAILFTAPGLSNAQEIIFQIKDPSRTPVNVGLIGTQNNEVFVYYLNFNKSDGYEAKVYQSMITLATEAGSKTLSVPYPLAFKGVGYTADHFVFLASHLDGRTEVPDARVTLVKVDRKWQAIKANADVELKGESDYFLFSEAGANYIISSAKSPARLRIRRIVDMNVEVFDYPMSSDQLSMWGPKVAYLPPTQTEPIPADINRKVLVRDGNVVVMVKKEVKEGASVTAYEFKLANPATFTSQAISTPGPKERMAITRFEDKLFLFETMDRVARIHILDLKTYQVLKTFSIDDENSPLLKGEFYRTGGRGLNHDRLYTAAAAYQRKMYVITRLRPWIQVWPHDETHLRVSFGDAVLSGELKEFMFMNLFLDPSTLEITTEPKNLSRRQYMLLRMNGERDASSETLSTFYTRENCFMLEQIVAAGTITLWK